MTDRKTVMSWLEGLAQDDWQKWYSDSEAQETAKAALVLLKEQEPKLVIRGRYNFPYCPHCSTEESRTELANMLYPEMKFCPYCGKGILWDADNGCNFREQKINFDKNRDAEVNIF